MLAKRDVKSIINGSKGHFLTVVFNKKDGTKRVLNGRVGVHSYLRGGVSNLDSNKFMIVWDAHKKDYRAVNMEEVIEIRSNGTIFRGER
jgi:hypothetical protein